MRSVIFFTALIATAFGECNPKGGKIEMLKTPTSVYTHKVGDQVSIVCAAHAEPQPIVYWVKGTGKTAKELPARASGTITLYFESIGKDDFDNYKCVVESCCDGKKTVAEVELKTPGGPDCNTKYGNMAVVFGVDWAYATHSEAKQNCDVLGLELAVVHSDEENEKLLEDIQTSFDRHPDAKKFAHDNWLWIGGTDSKEEGVWVDVYTEKQLTYFNWDKKQPDNWIGKKGKYYYNEGGQDYLAINRESGLWDDSFATHPRPYACRCPKRRG